MGQWSHHWLIDVIHEGRQGDTCCYWIHISISWLAAKTDDFICTIAYDKARAIIPHCVHESCSMWSSSLNCWVRGKEAGHTGGPSASSRYNHSTCSWRMHLGQSPHLVRTSNQRRTFQSQGDSPVGLETRVWTYSWQPKSIQGRPFKRIHGIGISDVPSSIEVRADERQEEESIY